MENPRTKKNEDRIPRRAPLALVPTKAARDRTPNAARDSTSIWVYGGGGVFVYQLAVSFRSRSLYRYPLFESLICCSVFNGSSRCFSSILLFVCFSSFLSFSLLFIGKLFLFGRRDLGCFAPILGRLLFLDLKVIARGGSLGFLPF